jgi:hypothetical protein
MEQHFSISFTFPADAYPHYESDYETVSHAVYEILQENKVDSIKEHISGTIMFLDNTRCNMEEKLIFWNKKFEGFKGLNYVISPLISKDYKEAVFVKRIDHAPDLQPVYAMTENLRVVVDVNHNSWDGVFCSELRTLNGIIMYHLEANKYMVRTGYSHYFLETEHKTGKEINAKELDYALHSALYHISRIKQHNAVEIHWNGE